jgi:hypothetical protein
MGPRESAFTDLFPSDHPAHRDPSTDGRLREAKLADALDEACKLLDNCRFSSHRPNDKVIVDALARLRAVLNEAG